MVIHAEDLHAAFRKELRVRPVLQPVVPAGNGFDLGPVQAFAHHLKPGAPRNLRNDLVRILRLTRIPRVGTRKPALCGVHRKIEFTLRRAAGRIGDDDEAAESGKSRQFELVISVRQGVEHKLPLLPLRPVAAAEELILPVTQHPPAGRNGGGTQPELQRLPLHEHRSRRRSGNGRGRIGLRRRGDGGSCRQTAEKSQDTPFHVPSQALQRTAVKDRHGESLFPEVGSTL